MADPGLAAEIEEQFAASSGKIAPDVLLELQSILRLHGISAVELFYKWESYNLKMGGDNVRLDLKTVRDFKKDIQDSLERETRGKLNARVDNKRTVSATPRVGKVSATGDLFDSMEGVVATPSVASAASVKRRNNFSSPASKVSKARADSSPSDGKVDTDSLVAFASRAGAGQIEQTLNNHIEIPAPPMAPFSQPRIKLQANSDIPKFGYKTMAMKLSEAAESLDDRLEKFKELVQDHYKLDFSDFGNPTIKTPNEIVVVGRICSELQESTKLTLSSVTLEAPLRVAGGFRIPLKFDNIPTVDLFPGKIVALRGTNASGEYFQVSEVLSLPGIPSPAHSADKIRGILQRLRDDGDEDADIKPLNVLIGSGPYTADTNLAFEPLQEICDKAIETSADALILVGPFLDSEHPLVASGDIPPLPASLNINPDSANLLDVFRGLISLPIQKLVQAVPSITVLMVPSVRDAINKHAAFPQERMIRKDLGLPKQCSVVTNPICISLNEAVFAITSQDILYELKRVECVKGHPPIETLPRLTKQLIEQRHFFPLFPPMSRDNLPKPTAVEGIDPEFGKPIGASIDTSYLAVAEFPNGVKPDVLISPSSMPTFVNVVDGVVCVNPGTVSKKKAAGTFARMTVLPPKLSDGETEVGARMFERCRVDVVKT